MARGVPRLRETTSPYTMVRAASRSSSPRCASGHSMRSLLIRSVAALVFAASFAAAADGYPARAVRVIVPFAPGGGTDVVGRILAAHLARRLGRSFMVDNREIRAVLDIDTGKWGGIGKRLGVKLD